VKIAYFFQKQAVCFHVYYNEGGGKNRAKGLRTKSRATKLRKLSNNIILLECARHFWESSGPSPEFSQTANVVGFNGAICENNPPDALAVRLRFY